MIDKRTVEEDIYKCTNYSCSPNCDTCDGYGRNLSCINTNICYEVKKTIFEGQPGYENVIGPAYPKQLEDKVVWYKNKFIRGKEHEDTNNK